MCLLLAAFAGVEAPAAGSAPRPTPALPQPSVSNSTPSREPAAPAPDRAPAAVDAKAPLPEFHAALNVGEGWFVLHRLAPQDLAPGAARVTALPLTQGEALITRRLGPATHVEYTLLGEGEICHASGLAQVWLRLDSGDPGEHAALGPAWIADEVKPCHLEGRPSAPLLAVPGKTQAYVAPTSDGSSVPQRVMPALELSCDTRGPLIGTHVEIAGRKFLVERAAGDPDALSVRELNGSVVWTSRAALTWDSVPGC